MVFDGPYLIVGTRKIAKCLAISRNTLYKLLDSGDFPVRKLENGVYVTTYGLIDEWVRAGWLANRAAVEPHDSQSSRPVKTLQTDPQVC